MDEDNKSLFLFPASVDIVKPYRAKPFPRTSSPSSIVLDQVLEKSIAGGSFFVEIRDGIPKALNTCNEEYRSPVRAKDRFVIEVLRQFDERNESVEFNDAKKLEIKGLKECNT